MRDGPPWRSRYHVLPMTGKEAGPGTFMHIDLEATAMTAFGKPRSERPRRMNVPVRLAAASEDAVVALTPADCAACYPLHGSTLALGRKINAPFGERGMRIFFLSLKPHRPTRDAVGKEEVLGVSRVSDALFLFSRRLAHFASSTPAPKSHSDSTAHTYWRCCCTLPPPLHSLLAACPSSPSPVVKFSLTL